MFYILAIAVCLAVMFLVLAAGSLLCIPGARLLLRMTRTSSARIKANLMFAVRLLPLGLACIVTFGLVLPAFLEFEPHSTGEGVGLRLIALAILGTLVLAIMVVRGLNISRATRQVQLRWQKYSERIDAAEISVPVYRVENAPSLLAVTGILSPRIFVAREITETLSPEELHAALAHEMAHVSSLDNLKQLLLKITRAPRWLTALYNTDAEWSKASEIAADHDALADGASVLDLSAALIKVGRLKRPAGGELVASHLVPTGCSGSLESRVNSLSEILEGAETAPVQTKRSNLLIPIAIALAAYLACIHAVLPAVHEALEVLVR